jgi:P27 family predicted phage terminase small subunit
VIRGNPGRRPIRHEPAPLVPVELPEPPAFLMPCAREEWFRLGQELLRLKLLTTADLQPFAGYCQAYGRWRTAEEALVKMAADDLVTFGLMTKTRDGNSMRNPLVLIADKAAATMLKYAAEFGLTPAARSRVSAVDRSAAESKFGPLLVG